MRVAQAVHVYGRHISQTLIVWTSDRTLVELRKEWVGLREAHSLPVRASPRTSLDGLDAAQRVREPDVDRDLHEHIRFCETQLLRIEELVRDLERLPTDDRYRPFTTAAHALLIEIGAELQRPEPPLPPEAPPAIRHAWSVASAARELIFRLLGLPWVREFMQRTPTEAPLHRRALREARDQLEVFFVDPVDP